jgi:uncharacterized protein YjbI with pentapeptide repeats
MSDAKIVATNMGKAVVRGTIFTDAITVNLRLCGAIVDANTIFAGTTFEDARMNDIDFRTMIGSNLDSCDVTVRSGGFWSANLVGADLRGANLSGADTCKLGRITLNAVRLMNANLSCAKLTNLIIANSDLVGSSYVNSSLHDIKILNSVANNMDFAGASITNVEFDNVFMAQSLFNNSLCDSVSLINSRAEEAVITNTQFNGITNVSGSSLNESEIHNTKFEKLLVGGRTMLRNADLSSVRIELCDAWENMHEATSNTTADDTLIDGISFADYYSKCAMNDID